MGDDQQGLTRRQMLKRGAALGGALVWAVPVVQTIGMTPALAQTPSGPSDGDGNCETLYAIRVSTRGCEDIAGQTAGTAPGGSLDVPLDVASGGCAQYAGGWNSADGSWQINFHCAVEIVGYAINYQETPEENNTSVEASATPSGDRKTTTFAAPERAISDIEIIFCCGG